jgi:hypothetical protein
MEIFEGDSFVVQGFEIPSDSPVFLTVLAIHILASITCVIAGIGAMLASKQHGAILKQAVFTIGCCGWYLSPPP